MLNSGSTRQSDLQGLSVACEGVVEIFEASERDSKIPSVTTALARRSDGRQLVLQTAIELWAAAATGVSSRRRGEVLRNKRAVVEAFFGWVQKSPAEVEPADINAWCERMREEGKRP